ncbi:low temperature requirement protein A [Frondihabitans sp. 4ASC-45]|uniref:low temperature requirement protein A n=1 Tax=Frondihabitans sp. 4ASC-45 TaxID=3111636 RepID=UPI003C2247A8
MSEAASTATGFASSNRATPLELFFDLVYVFAFTQVTHLMADGESVRSVLSGLAVLGVLWWSWASHAWLANQQIADRGAVRVGILVAIAIVLVLSIAIPKTYPHTLESRSGALLFAIGFVLLSLAYTAVNVVAARRDSPLRRQVIRTMGATVGPVAAALIVGALVGGIPQIVLWLAAVALEGITVFATSQGGAWQLPSAAHYAERHGLVVILALGESIISIGLAASGLDLTPSTVLVSLAAVSVSLGMWWIYFGRVSSSAEGHIDTLVGNRRTAIATIGTYLHFGIVAGILLVSLGLGGVIERLGSGEPPGSFSWISAAGGAALFLAATTVYARITRTTYRKKKYS